MNNIEYITCSELYQLIEDIKNEKFVLNMVFRDYNFPYTWYFRNSENKKIYLNEVHMNLITEMIENMDTTNEINTNEVIENFNNQDRELSSLSEEQKELLEKITEEAHKEIPENSKSLLIDETTSRFSSAIWYEEIQKKVITLAGIGGIGSYVGFLLSRLKPKSINIFDPDVVETGNLSGQLYGSQDIGDFKVTALSALIHNYSEYYSIWSFNRKFTDNDKPTDIMICGFDSMEARSIFFHKWVSHIQNKLEEEKKSCLFIDGRLAAEEFQVLCITGNDDYNISRYESQFLFPDNLADSTVCSYKQTSFMANMIGSIIINLFVNFAANLCTPLVDRDLPFYTAYNAETMYFKTER